MNICFISENGHNGKLPRNFPNCRTEFAFQIALNADHLNIKGLLTGNVPYPSKIIYDLAIIILPKKLELYDITLLYSTISSFSSKIAIMQEGPHWYYQDYNYSNQINYFNFLKSVDFILCHNKSDISYFEGMFNKPTFNLQSLMITDTIVPTTETKINSGYPIIGGSFTSWYSGIDSYMVARNFEKPIYIPSMGRKIENEEQFPDLHHLPYMMWKDWMNTLSQFNVGIHLMRTHAAGTFSLNCAYYGIPCIGYKGLDTQETLFPDLSINIGDIKEANKLALQLKNDSEFYNMISKKSIQLYYKHYCEKIWLEKWNNIVKQIWI